MNCLDILWIADGIIFAIGIIIAFTRWREIKSFKRNGELFGSLWCIVLSSIITAFILMASFRAYYYAVSLPYEYDAKCMAVDETAGYLMRFENITVSDGSGIHLESLGQGLESIEYKQQLARLVKEKYELYGSMMTYIKNPLNPYRDIMESGMREVGVTG